MKRNIVIIAVLLLSSCTPVKPLTPLQAFESAKRAVFLRDTKAFYNIISSSSRKKISASVLKMHSLDEKQHERLAKSFSTKPAMLKNITSHQYLEFYISDRNNALVKALKKRQISVEKKSNLARITVQGGMVLEFVKEGPYWLLDLTNH
jgi:hypothetical protein